MRVAVIFLIVVMIASNAFCTNVEISPVKIFLTSSKVDKIIIKNHEEKETSIQIRVYEWKQENGNDVYLETNKLIVMPKFITLKSGEEKVIRVGINQFTEYEESYRIYFEEIPRLEEIQKGGANLKLYMKIGVPVFVKKDNKNEYKVDVEHIDFVNEKLRVQVNNKGKNHVLTGLSIIGKKDSKEVFRKETGVWYLLANSSRKYDIDVRKENVDTLIINILSEDGKEKLLKEIKLLSQKE